MARSYCEQSIAICRRQGSHYLAWPLLCLGNIWLAEGEYEQARSTYAESLRIFQASGDRWGIAFALDCHAAVAGATGCVDGAARLFGSAEALREQLGVVPFSGDQTEPKDLVNAIRFRLDREAATLPWAAGRALTLEEAITLALGEARVAG